MAAAEVVEAGEGGKPRDHRAAQDAGLVSQILYVIQEVFDSRPQTFDLRGSFVDSRRFEKYVVQVVVEVFQEVVDRIFALDAHMGKGSYQVAGVRPYLETGILQRRHVIIKGRVILVVQKHR